MSDPFQISRRRFLRQTFAFSAASTLAGCGSGVRSIAGSDASHLLMLGDWGAAGGHGDQNRVAAAMQAYVKRENLNTQALLLLGDSFYGELGSVDSPRWSEQFEQMYPSSVFDCPAYSIPGNHDYIYDDQALRFNVELQYAALGKSRWTMPSQFYRYTFPKVDPILTVIALDSNIPYADGSTVAGPFTTMSESQRRVQLAWLERELAKPLATPFLAVAGHHPLYSDGPHGDHPELIRDWDPLFRKYNVHLYLAGHDHDLQHLEFEQHPTSFFCSGGGGANLYPLRTQEAERGPYAQETFGFSHLEGTAKLLTLRHVDANGTVIHAFTKSPNHKVTILI
jgi:tartrate-resistant acid phosphatase type 5